MSPISKKRKDMMKVLNVVGARPNFMKMAPIIAEMNTRGDEISQTHVHTGQHYDDAMSGAFFRDLGMAEPDVHLDVRDGTHAEQTARVMLAFEGVVAAHKPDWVVVVGDVNSTLACALVAGKMGVRVAHVEAGLRSGDWTMPEEINRVLTDRLSDLLLTPSPDADRNLLSEGIAPERIVRVGNVMIDTLYHHIERARRSTILDDLSLKARKFAAMTLHRPSNVDDPDSLRRIFAAVGRIARALPVVFPAHPRSLRRMREFGVEPPQGVKVIAPLGYLDFLMLWSNSMMALTDSGGLQEETTALGVPCLTLRENTERPITVEQGTNQVVGLDPERIVAAAEAIIAGRNSISTRTPELWDGRAAARIVTALLTRSDHKRQIAAQ